MFVAMLGMLMLFVGGAIDFARYNMVRAELVESLDSAGLAIAQLDAMNGPAIRDLSESARETYLKDYGRQFFNANFGQSAPIENLLVDFVITDMTITPTASGKLRTLLLPIGDMLVSGTNGANSSLARLSLDTNTEITRAQVGNTEVSVVLDTTGSMAGQRIADLKDAATELVDILVRDDQSQFYTKVALVPYSMSVNAAGLATSARGAIAAGKAMTGAAWRDGNAKNIGGATWKSGATKAITNVNKANPARVTSNAHGFLDGDRIYITGVVGMTQLNNKQYTVANKTNNDYRLQGTNSSGYSNYSSGGSAQKCWTTSCEVVITINSHGWNTGDTVYVTGSSFAGINGNVYSITRLDANNFVLDGATNHSYGNGGAGGTVSKCLVSGCEVVVTSNNHGFQTNDYVHILGVVGMTQINNTVTDGVYTNDFWQIVRLTANTFSLNTTFGPNYSNYTSGGTAYCTTQGCEFFRFTNQSGSAKAHRISTCVSERTGDHAFTDAAPSTSLLGRVYSTGNNPCTTPTVTPLSSDKVALKAAVAALQAGGSTGAHIGVAWGWYMVSPNFASILPVDSQPAAYTAQDVTKVAIIMTDGEFNSSYCNGVISGVTSTNGSGGNADKINCAAPNGHAYVQAQALCDAMKAAGVLVYTVGFMIDSQQAAQDIMNNCATGPTYRYLADSGASLKTAFKNIAHDIARLHISR